MLDEDIAWQAVATSDKSSDGKFFYAVKTTGIYCKPGCASRKPLRENTLFFAHSDAAEASGFRACKRCKP